MVVELRAVSTGGWTSSGTEGEGAERKGRNKGGGGGTEGEGAEQRGRNKGEGRNGGGGTEGEGRNGGGGTEVEGSINTKHAYTCNNCCIYVPLQNVIGSSSLLVCKNACKLYSLALNVLGH